MSPKLHNSAPMTSGGSVPREPLISRIVRPFKTIAEVSLVATLASAAAGIYSAPMYDGTTEATVETKVLGEPEVRSIKGDKSLCFAQAETLVSTAATLTMEKNVIGKTVAKATRTEVTSVFNPKLNERNHLLTLLCLNGEYITYEFQHDALRFDERNTEEDMDQPPVVKLTVPADALSMKLLANRSIAMDSFTVSWKGAGALGNIGDAVVESVPIDNLPFGLKEGGLTSSQKAENITRGVAYEMAARAAITGCAAVNLDKSKPGSGKMLDVAASSYKQLIVKQYNAEPNHKPITEDDVEVVFEGYKGETLDQGASEYQESADALIENAAKRGVTLTINIPTSEEIVKKSEEIGCKLSPKFRDLDDESVGRATNNSQKGTSLGGTKHE